MSIKEMPHVTVEQVLARDSSKPCPAGVCEFNAYNKHVSALRKENAELVHQLSEMKANLPKVMADAVHEAVSRVSSGAIDVNHRFMIIEQPYCYVSTRALREFADKLEAGDE